jgi:drug/metabolite transporter (DMT)-like permease
MGPNPASNNLPPLQPMPKSQGNALSFVALLLGAVGIGFAPIFVRLSSVGPISTAFWRLALALPLLCFLAVLGQKRAAIDPDRDRNQPPAPAFALPGAMIWAGLFFTGDLAVWHWSIKFTTVTNSTLLANFSPMWVVVFGWVVFGERITRGFFMAMLVALAGVVLLIGSDFALQARALFGDALGFATAIFYAAYLLAIKDLRARFATTSILASTGLVTAAALLPLALISETRFLPQTAHAWGILAALALISHVGGQGLIAYALARLPAAVASVGLLLQPVTAALAAAALLGERISAMQVLGMALVLAGVFAARQQSGGTTPQPGS